jgi:hypothetical protein
VKEQPCPQSAFVVRKSRTKSPAGEIDRSQLAQTLDTHRQIKKKIRNNLLFPPITAPTSRNIQNI